jgi:uncharacterized NAD(P)/FAD-binding protein YdhS
MVEARSSWQRVAVIGGGAAGTLVAVHLMRSAAEVERAIEISLIHSGPEIGPGIAYGTDDPLHLLNIPASRMGAISGRPDHFQEWLRGRGQEVGAGEFVPRSLFGSYLRALLSDTEEACGGFADLRRLRGEVVGLKAPVADAESLRLDLGDGRSLEADDVVLALGPLEGADPVPVPEELCEAGVYIARPWVPGAIDIARGDRDVLMIGTGLTAADMILSLTSQGDGPRIRAVSRHGLLPRRHRDDLTRIEPFPVPLDEGRLEPVLAAVIERLDSVARDGGDWRDVLDSLRLSTPKIWRALLPEEKRRFYSSLERFWQVHRFRMAPAIADRLDELLGEGSVRIDARTIVAVEAGPRGARVSLEAAGAGGIETVDVDRVINCTGPGARIEAQASTLLRDLLDQGSARVDELGIGLDVAANGALIDSAGRPSERIRVVGALRKGVEWESLGVGEDPRPGGRDRGGSDRRCRPRAPGGLNMRLFERSSRSPLMAGMAAIFL